MSIIELLVIVLISLGIFDKSKILYYFNKISKFQNGQSRQIIGDNSIDENWYLIENDELNLVNHWVPESKLELHKQPLRESKLEQLGIK